MKKLCVFLLFLSYNIHIFSQDLVNISGRVFDSETGSEIAFASASITEPDGKIVSGAISDDRGRFIIKGNFQGEYTIEVSFIGYNTSRRRILIGELNTNFDLGRINLELSNTQIEEVIVQGQRSVISSGLDKKSYSRMILLPSQEDLCLKQ